MFHYSGNHKLNLHKLTLLLDLYQDYSLQLTTNKHDKDLPHTLEYTYIGMYIATAKPQPCMA